MVYKIELTYTKEGEMMININAKKYIDRLKNIRDEGCGIASLENSFSYIEETDRIEAWLISAENIISKLFDLHSIQYRAYRKASMGHIESASQILSIKGVLDGIIADIEGGYIEGLVTEITINILSDILYQAKELLREGLKDVAAIYGRISLEKNLKELAEKNNIASNQRANKINDDLRNKNIYTQIRWREIQVWLDIGNKSAHGEFNDYTNNDVENMLDGVERFIKDGL